MDTQGNASFKGHLGIRVIRAHPTLRSRVLDAWAAFLRRLSS